MRLGEYMGLIREGRPVEAELVRQSTIPSKLIKFVWLDGGSDDEKKFKTLANNEIWISTRKNLNDPYEFKGLVLDRQTLADAGYPEQLVEGYQSMLDFEGLGVTCLSANQVDYLPMWAYYTNNHKGFCVEYAVLKKDCIHEVLYEERRTKVSSLLIQYQDAVKEAMRRQVRTPEADYLGRILLQNLYIKAATWKHEREFRVAYPIDVKNGLNVPVSRLGMMPAKIVAGINCAENAFEELNRLSNRLGLGDAYKCKLNDDEYVIDVIR